MEQQPTIEETHQTSDDIWGLGESSLILIGDEITELLKEETSHE